MVSAFLLSLGPIACASAEEPEAREVMQELGEEEDALAEAYNLFKLNFQERAQDRFHTMGFGPVPMSTSVPPADPSAEEVRGSVTLDFDGQRVTGTIVGLPPGDEFDLWFLKNTPALGSSIGPDPGDQYIKVGTFSDAGLLQKSIDVVVGDDVNFLFDALVVTEKDSHPTSSLVYFGARTLFEKRFFLEQAGLAMTPVSGPLGAVETSDPLVARGAEVFFNETFAGNGRTCGTCHRAENNLTIDPDFIATLPQSDPLFVAETVPELAGLEVPDKMREFGVILENVDGFEDPENKFVLRGVNHTLSLATTLLPDNGILATETPPDQRTGWGGDGAPGRGTLQEFALGAINQHFTQRLERAVGSDFRLPTQAETDALEAFQLFTGRASNPPAISITFNEPRANSGRDLFVGDGKCSTCHRDVVGQNNAPNFDLDTGIEAFTAPSGFFPPDGGLGTAPDPNRPGAFGSGKFNVPPVIEAADTAPLFHNHIQEDLESAISFYQSAAFDVSPAAQQFSGPILIGDQDTVDLAIFLRILNSAENMRQVRRRIEFIRNNPGPGEAELFVMAIADTNDAREVLQARTIEVNPTARHHIADAAQTLVMAQAHPPGATRDAYLNWALFQLESAREDLFSDNPLDLF